MTHGKYALAAVALLTATPALAHHALSMFDRHTTVTVTGVVKEFVWGNPHVWIELVSDPNEGMVMAWSIEAGSPTVLARGGWRPSAIKPGDIISVGIHPRKDGISGGYLDDGEPLRVNGRILIGGVKH
jgi:hypothetical protein